MKIRKIISILALSALSIAPALYGQAQPDDKKQPQRQEQQADRPGDATITGCLSEQAGAFMIAAPGGQQISVSGSPDLSKHKDHTVKLTGTKSEEGGKPAFNVTKIEMVSDSCSK
jgi:hypothetical protein